MRARLAIWSAIAVAVVLATRVVVYALAPSELQLAQELEERAGGPHLAGALVGICLAAAALAAAALWLAVVAVRERMALEGRRLVAAPRVSLRRLALRAPALFVTTSFAFAMLESYIHWREGLGWHGLHCLIGPVHRDAIPVLAALSVVAVAIHGAVEHLLAWARRSVVLLGARLPALRRTAVPRSAVGALRLTLLALTNVARGPPVFFVPLTSI